MKLPYLDMTYQHDNRLKKKILKEISDCIDNNNYIDGRNVKEFEEKFAEFCGSRYCVAVNSGTSALHLAVKIYFSYNRVAIPGNSFFATASCFLYENKEPIFIDIDKYCNISVNQLTNNINMYDHIIPVSLYGNPCDLEKISSLNKKFIHDACQAHGAMINNKPISNYSELTCYSFYPSKNLGGFGEGGAIVTDNKDLYDQLNILKNHGQATKYNHEYIGFNYRLNEIQAISLKYKLKYLNQWNDERIALANRYNNNLKNNNLIDLLNIKENNKCVYHVYPIFTKYKENLIQLFNDYEIGYNFHYPIMIYDQKSMSNFKINLDNLQYTESIKNNEISLPLYVGMKNNDVDYICEVINKLCK